MSPPPIPPRSPWLLDSVEEELLGFNTALRLLFADSLSMLGIQLSECGDKMKGDSTGKLK